MRPKGHAVRTRPIRQQCGQRVQLQIATSDAASAGRAKLPSLLVSKPNEWNEACGRRSGSTVATPGDGASLMLSAEAAPEAQAGRISFGGPRADQIRSPYLKPPDFAVQRPGLGGCREVPGGTGKFMAVVRGKSRGCTFTRGGNSKPKKPLIIFCQAEVVNGQV
jgi:hypothetical protein